MSEGIIMGKERETWDEDELRAVLDEGWNQPGPSDEWLAKLDRRAPTSRKQVLRTFFKDALRGFRG